MSLKTAICKVMILKHFARNIRFHTHPGNDVIIEVLQAYHRYAAKCMNLIAVDEFHARLTLLAAVEELHGLQ